MLNWGKLKMITSRRKPIAQSLSILTSRKTNKSSSIGIKFNDHHYRCYDFYHRISYTPFWVIYYRLNTYFAEFYLYLINMYVTQIICILSGCDTFWIRDSMVVTSSFKLLTVKLISSSIACNFSHLWRPWINSNSELSFKGQLNLTKLYYWKFKDNFYRFFNFSRTLLPNPLMPPNTLFKWEIFLQFEAFIVSSWSRVDRFKCLRVRCKIFSVIYWLH